MLAHPNLCSRRSVYEQYDHEVGADTVVRPGEDAAVVRIKGTKLGFAVATDCQGRHCYLDPRGGGAAAVAEAYRNLSCVGAEPVAITDCLNFGSPEKPDAYYQLAECIEGMAEACEVFGTPVVSGNVSLYNETERGAIYPTPTVGMVGVFEDVSRCTTVGSVVRVMRSSSLGTSGPRLRDRSTWRSRTGRSRASPPEPDLRAEKAASDAVRRAVVARIADTAHDLSAGGLAVALAEMAIQAGVGAEVRLLPGARQDVALFGEAGGCFLVTVSEGRLEELTGALEGAHCSRIGRIGGDRLIVPGLLDVGLGRCAPHTKATSSSGTPQKRDTLADAEKVNLTEKLSLFDEHWSPKIVAELKGQHVKLVKLSVSSLGTTTTRRRAVFS
jgi:phosphoribosylformylglycinamidine synthase